ARVPPDAAHVEGARGRGPRADPDRPFVLRLGDRRPPRSRDPRHPQRDALGADGPGEDPEAVTAMASTLITGGAGFIGSHLAERLLADGRRVVVLDNFDTFYAPDVKRRNVSLAMRSTAYRLVEGDIRDRAALDGLLGSEG